MVCTDHVHLIVAHTDADSLVGGEGDGLLVQLVNADSRILCLELTAEVELVVGLTRQTEDIRCGSRQQRIARIVARRAVVLLIGVIVGILLVVLVSILIVVVPEEGVGVLLVDHLQRQDSGSWPWQAPLSSASMRYCNSRSQYS